MAASHLSRKTLDDLKQRHLAFLEERLVSRQAREDWKKAFREGFDLLLDQRIREVIQPAMLAKGLHKALTADSIRTFFAPLVRDLQREALASAKSDETSLGEYVPPNARLAIEALLDRRGLVPEALVRKVFEQQVVVDTVHDTLYEGLTQFNTTVNPFFADWGLPAILKRMPIGGSLILASMDAMRAEFDRRLEPEIRKFLAAFSKRATAELAELVLTRSGDPKFVELRRNLVAFLYSQSPAELLAGVDDEAAQDLGTVVERIVLDVIRRDRRGDSLRRVLEEVVTAQGDATFGEWLEEIGATGRPDLDAWADLMWPHVERVIRSSLVRDYIRQVTEEFYDGLEG